MNALVALSVVVVDVRLGSGGAGVPLSVTCTVNDAVPAPAGGAADDVPEYSVRSVVDMVGQVCGLRGDRVLPGVRFVPIQFTPNGSVFKDKKCKGVNIILTDRTAPVGWFKDILPEGFPAGAAHSLELAYFFDIPTFGKTASGTKPWETMYDVPRHEQPKARLGVLQVIAAIETRRKMARNTDVAILAARRILNVLDPGQAEDFEAAATITQSAPRPFVSEFTCSPIGALPSRA